MRNASALDWWFRPIICCHVAYCFHVIIPRQQVSKLAGCHLDASTLPRWDLRPVRPPGHPRPVSTPKTTPLYPCTENLVSIIHIKAVPSITCCENCANITVNSHAAWMGNVERIP